MSMTVTLTNNANIANAVIAVKVYTQATEAGGGGNSADISSGTTCSTSVTPTSSGSTIVYFVGDSAHSNSLTALTNCSQYDGTNGTSTGNSEEFASGHFTGTVTAGTGVTVGANCTSGDNVSVVAYEIQGKNIALDGSTPAEVITLSSNSAVTASFTPPPGSVLVAMGLSNANAQASAPTFTISDSSGGKLTWTQREFQGNGSGANWGGSTVLFTATVPLAGVVPAPIATGIRQRENRKRSRAVIGGNGNGGSAWGKINAPPALPQGNPFPPMVQMARMGGQAVFLAQHGTLLNNFEEGTNGTTISTANSGGSEQNAFDSVNIGSTGAITYSNAQAAHGTLSAALTVGATAGTTDLEWNTTSFGTNPVFWFRLYGNFTTLPSNNNRIFTSSDGSGGGLRLASTTNGHIQVQNSAGVTVYQFVNAVTTGTNVWFRLEGLIVRSTSSGAAQISLYNTQDSLTPTESCYVYNISTIDGTSAGKPDFGMNGANANNALNLDDIGVSVTGYLGPANLPPLIPVVGGTGITWRLPRQYSRGYYGGQRAPVNQSGSIQPQSTIPVPRKETRLRRWIGNNPLVNWGAIEAPVNQSGHIQPLAAQPSQRPPSRRTRAWIAMMPWGPYGKIDAPVNQVGRVQPLSTFPVPRRKSARAYTAHGYGQVNTYGVTQGVTSQPYQRPPSRRSRAYTKHLYGGVFGNTVNRLSVTQRVPRQRPRAYSLINASSAVLVPVGQPGSVQPWPTISTPRRKAARAGQWSRVYGQSNTYGMVQPWPTIPLPRKDKRQRFWINNDPQPWDVVLGTQRANPVNSGSISQRPSAIRHARAYVFHVAATTLGASINRLSITQRVPRQRPRAYSVILPAPLNQSGHVQPWATVPVPRRKSARAGLWSHVYGQPNTYGVVQPWSTIAIPRRKSSRAGLWHWNAGSPPVIFQVQGTVQAWPTIPVPRRKSTRAGQWHWNNGQISTYGMQQPWPTIATPRRKSTRAVTAHNYGQTNTYGVIQPLPTKPPRRTSVRAYTHSYDFFYSLVASGTVQPWATVPTPRRRTARGFWRWNGYGLVSGQVQPRATVSVPRRYQARGIWHWNAGQIGVLGRIQPRTTVPVPRRYPSRAGSWHGVAGIAPTIFFNFGTVQALPTFPVPRRKSARLGTWRWVAGAAAPPQGPPYIQPRTTIAVPRRYPSRGQYHGNIGPGYLNGQVQPLTTRQPRRYPSRGVWHWNGGAAHQPAVTWYTRIPRRYQTRGQYRLFGAPQPPSGTVQPQPTTIRMLPRRTAARGFWRQVKALLPGASYVQPWATVPIPRRKVTRALISLPYASDAGGQKVPGTVDGTVQPLCTFPISRRNNRQHLAVWRIQPGPSYINGQTQPTATRLPRRTSARAVFLRSAQGQPHFAYAEPRTTIPIARRYPARGQFRGNAVAPVAVTYIQPRTFIPRRYPARAVVRSTYVPYWFFGSGGKTQPTQTRPSRRTGTRATVRTTQAPFTTSVSFGVSFNILNIAGRDFGIAFNIYVPGKPKRQGLLASLPWLSPSVSKMYPGGNLQNPPGDGE